MTVYSEDLEPMTLAPVNMHMHSHFSFNADGLPPAQVVEQAKRRGIYAAAIVDFDVLDGLEEFYAAADEAGLRTAVGLETRVFFAEYGDQVINSPGEPGVYYFMGMGFGRMPDEESYASKTIERLRVNSANRNRALTARINAAFPDIAIDYDADVLPLTPSGNATERHIVRGYIEKARSYTHRDRAKQKELWMGILGLAGEQVEVLLDDAVALQNAVRASLMKQGGAGYIRPDASTFPPVEKVIRMVLDAGAIPMATWLDGFSEGESDMETQLECLRSKRIAALNIIPDRNWNIPDPQKRAAKAAKLHEVVHIAEKMGLPLNVGTELNSFGQPFVDDFEAEPMRPLWRAFFQGANVMVGQSRLARFAGFSYCGPEAASEFGRDLAAKNTFFMEAGMLQCPDVATCQRLQEMENDQAFARICDAVAAKKGPFAL